jgi:hypothetical protein
VLYPGTVWAGQTQARDLAAGTSKAWIRYKQQPICSVYHVSVFSLLGRGLLEVWLWVEFIWWA